MSFLKLFICVTAASGILLGAGAASASASASTAGRTGTAYVVRADSTPPASDSTPPASDGEPGCTSCWG